MFYLIQFSKSDNNKNIIINSHNNILSECKIIKSKKDKMIIWYDNIITEKNYYLFSNFLKANELHCFIELKEINNTPYDWDWKWDDKYISSIFNKIL
jgi:hypothetical protein